MREEWKPLDNGRYEVSNLGRVRSFFIGHKRRRIPLNLVVYVCKRSGYLRCSFKGKPKDVHQLVALGFIGERPDGKEVAHLDGNKLNVSPSNLAYVTRKENNSHRLLHGTDYNGIKNPRVKLNEDQVREILSTPFTLGIVTKMASRFGVNKSTITKIRKGIRWHSFQLEATQRR